MKPHFFEVDISAGKIGDPPWYVPSDDLVNKLGKQGVARVLGCPHAEFTMTISLPVDGSRSSLGQVKHLVP